MPGDPALIAESWGFTLTPTPGDPDHGRVHLDRCYLELQAGSRLDATTLFLRAPDRRAAIEELECSGVAVGKPRSYQGRDGLWLDATLGPERREGAAVILTQRVEPQELARDWPPPLTAEHPNGARSLACVELAGEVAGLAPLACHVPLELAPGPRPARIAGLRIEGTDSSWTLDFEIAS